MGRRPRAQKEREGGRKKPSKRVGEREKDFSDEGLLFPFFSSFFTS
jgi:hypothetical protein